MPYDRSRPDACPGALQLHQAADGALARVRLPGGRLSGVQMGVLASASRDLGAGLLELTSRANLQVRALRDGTESELAARLADAGLLPSATHERVRNIVASPLSGLDHLGAADVRPLVTALDEALCARPELASLPGRFLFALDDGRRDVAPGLKADVAAVGVAPDEFLFELAGTPVRRFPASQIIDVMLGAAEAFLAERRAQGSQVWRLAELVDGVPSVLRRMSLESLSTMSAPSSSVLRPLVGVVGRDAVGAVAALGRLTWRQAEVLSRFSQVVVAPWRGVVVPGDAAVLAELGSYGFVVDPEAVLLGVTACTGRPGCAKALADVQADALAVLREGGRAVHFAGCERRCGRPSGVVVDVVASVDGYLVDGEPSVDLGVALTAARKGL